MKNKLISAICAISMMFGVSALPIAQNHTAYAEESRQMENLGRGVVAIRSESKKVFISWRLLALDNPDVGFNIYRKTNGTAAKLNSDVLTGGTNFTDTTADLSKDNEYFVKPVINGKEKSASASYVLKANSETEPCYTVPLNDGGEIRDVWVGDLDGDGEYDFVLNRMGTEQSIEAYTNKGKHLWTVDYGPLSQNQNNISPGAATISVGMWDGVTVYDFDCDGKAEVVTKAANGTVFGDGNSWGKGNDNEQWLVVLDGMTGALRRYSKLPTDYISAGPLAMQLGVGYLDGKPPSIIASMKNRNSDKSFNMMVCAYKFTNSKLSLQWKWTRDNQDLADGHQFRVADIDKDGQDEICHIGFTLESDGSLKYSLSKKGIVHGDRFYVGQFSKTGPIRGYGIQQDNPDGLLEYYYNASNGNITWKHSTSGTDNDVGRGDVGDLDPRYDGFEVWSFSGIYNGPKNTQITTSDNQPYPAISIWWDGDLLRESINSGKIEKWNYESSSVSRLATTWKFHNATKNNRDLPLFHGDMIGDWREEVIYKTPENDALIIFTTPTESDTRLYTLAQNPLYRNCMALKGYVESHTLDYYLGSGMDTPAQPNITTIGGNNAVTEETSPYAITEGVYYIKNVNSGLYLDVENGSAENGANIQQYTFNGSTAQQFKIVSVGDDYYKILTACSDYAQAVDVSGKKTDDGTNILTWKSGSGKNQQFKFQAEDDGSYAILTRITNDASALDVYGVSTKKGANVCQWSYWGGAGQRWYLEKVN